MMMVELAGSRADGKVTVGLVYSHTVLVARPKSPSCFPPLSLPLTWWGSAWPLSPLSPPASRLSSTSPDLLPHPCLPGSSPIWNGCSGNLLNPLFRVNRNELNTRAGFWITQVCRCKSHTHTPHIQRGIYNEKMQGIPGQLSCVLFWGKSCRVFRRSLHAPC